MLVERKNHTDAIVILTFNRPEKLNALSSALLKEFRAHLEAIEADPAARVVILTGAGEKAFIAGADISEYSEQDLPEFVAYSLFSRDINDYLERFPKPTIAAVNGYALGGGFEIALCCDVLLASSNARLGLPEGLLGLSPGGGGTQRLIRSVGRYVAADLLLSARRLSAQRAYELGIVAEVTEPADLLPKAIEKAEYMLKVAPLAAQEMKRLLRVSADAALPTGLALEQEICFRLFTTQDGQEGIRAFVEKRDPNFRGA